MSETSHSEEISILHPIRFLQAVGRVFLAFLATAGRLTLFTIEGTSHCFRGPWYFRIIGRQMVEIGYYSLPVVGLTAVFAGMEGTRPMLMEIQALVAPGPPGSPRRTVVGWDSSRLAMIIAVLQTRCGMNLGSHDVYLNVAGGLRV